MFPRSRSKQKGETLSRRKVSLKVESSASPLPTRKKELIMPAKKDIRNGKQNVLANTSQERLQPQLKKNISLQQKKDFQQKTWQPLRAIKTKDKPHSSNSHFSASIEFSEDFDMNEPFEMQDTTFNDMLDDLDSSEVNCFECTFKPKQLAVQLSKSREIPRKLSKDSKNQPLKKAIKERISLKSIPSSVLTKETKKQTNSKTKLNSSLIRTSVKNVLGKSSKKTTPPKSTSKTNNEQKQYQKAIKELKKRILQLNI